jgi:hypothetical protein
MSKRDLASSWIRPQSRIWDARTEPKTDWCSFHIAHRTVCEYFIYALNQFPGAKRRSVLML